MDIKKVSSIEVIDPIVVSYNNVYKKDIYNMYKPRAEKEIRCVIREFIMEHNNLKSTALNLSLNGHSVPYWLYEKIVAFFDEN